MQLGIFCICEFVASSPYLQSSPDPLTCARKTPFPFFLKADSRGGSHLPRTQWAASSQSVPLSIRLWQRYWTVQVKKRCRCPTADFSHLPRTWPIGICSRELKRFRLPFRPAGRQRRRRQQGGEEGFQQELERERRRRRERCRRRRRRAPSPAGEDDAPLKKHPCRSAHAVQRFSSFLVPLLNSLLDHGITVADALVSQEPPAARVVPTTVGQSVSVSPGACC